MNEKLELLGARLAKLEVKSDQHSEGLTSSKKDLELSIFAQIDSLKKEA